MNVGGEKVFLNEDEKRVLQFLRACELAKRKPNVNDLDPPMDTDTAARAIRTLIVLGLVEPT